VRLLRIRGRAGRRSRGQALVEFAFVLPIFLFILMILVDFGRIVYAQNAITQDAREAARVGSTGVVGTGLGDPGANSGLGPMSAKYNAIRAAAQIMSPGVPMTAASVTGMSGDCTAYADPLGTHTCFYPDGTQVSNRVVINITVIIPILTPIISNVVGGSYTLTASSIAYIQ
jgi:Flp pilus assembly protein TadG